MKENIISNNYADKNDIFSMISRHRSEIMGFAALWIIFFHVWIPVFSSVPGLSFAESYIKRIGFCGVDIFFFLSGIGMVFAVGKSTLGQFYYRRIKRLILPFVLVGVLKMFTNGWDIAKFAEAVSGYSFYFENIYTLLWFVPAVVTFYLLFPLYHKLLEKSGNAVLFTLVVLEIWLILSVKANGLMRRDLFGFTNRIPVFLLGVLFAYTSKDKKIALDKNSAIFAVVTLILGAYLAYLTNLADMFLIVQSSNSFLPNLLMTVSICPLLAFILDKLPFLGKILGFFGLFTLEFYCIQEWLAEQILDRLSAVMPVIAANIVFLAITTALAYVIYIVNKFIWKQIDKVVLRK